MPYTSEQILDMLVAESITPEDLNEGNYICEGTPSKRWICARETQHKAIGWHDPDNIGLKTYFRYLSFTPPCTLTEPNGSANASDLWQATQILEFDNEWFGGAYDYFAWTDRLISGTYETDPETGCWVTQFLEWETVLEDDYCLIPSGSGEEQTILAYLYWKFYGIRAVAKLPTEEQPGIIVPLIAIGALMALSWAFTPIEKSKGA